MYHVVVCPPQQGEPNDIDADDKPESPEDVPKHEQKMKCARVIRTNYSLLYGHLDAGKLLSKLPEKDLISDTQFKVAESYQQRFAKNAVVIETLLMFDRPSHGLLKFCDILETTSGQEHLGRKLLKGIKLSAHENQNSRSKYDFSIGKFANRLSCATSSDSGGGGVTNSSNT